MTKCLLTLGGAFAIRSSQGYNSLVDLDSGNDVVVLEQLDEWGAVISLLVEGLVEEDHSADVVGELLAGCEQQLTVLAAVLLNVLHVDGGEALAHGASALVSGQDALAGGNDGIGNGTQLLLLLLAQVWDKARHDSEINTYGVIALFL